MIRSKFFRASGGRLFVLSAALSVSFLAFPGAGASDESAEKALLVIAISDRSATKAEKQFRPVAAYLADRLRDFGIKESTVLVPRETAALAERLKEGKVDLVFGSPYAVFLYQRDSGARILLQGSRRGLRSFLGRIFVRKGSGLRSLEDLRGRIIALKDGGSTAEYFLPRLSLQAGGLELVEVRSADEAVPPGKVGYIFAGDELNISTWVFYGKVDAGALGSGAWTEQSLNPEAYRRQFEIIHETALAPALLVAVRRDLDESLAAGLQQELLDMSNNADGRSALQAYDIDFFSPPDPSSLESFKAIFTGTGTAGRR